MTDGSGTSLNDNGPSAVNGTLQGASWSTDFPLLISDNGEYTLSFDGSDDYITLSNNNLNDFTDKLSFSAWVYVTGGDNSHRNIITNGDTQGFALTVSSANKFRPHIQNQNGWLNFDGNTTVENNVWYHIAFTYDGSIVKIYVNGEEATIRKPFDKANSLNS